MNSNTTKVADYLAFVGLTNVSPDNDNDDFGFDLVRAFRFGNIRTSSMCLSTVFLDYTNAGRRGLVCEGVRLLEGMFSVPEWLEFINSIKAVGPDLTIQDVKAAAAATLPSGSWETFDRPSIKVSMVQHLDFPEYSIQFSNREFTIRDKRDTYNLPVAYSQKARDAASFRKILNGFSMGHLAEITFRELLNELDNNRISYRYYCSMD